VRKNFKLRLFFIFLTILSGLNICAKSIESDIQISGKLVENQYSKTADIENLFKSNLNLNGAIVYSIVPRGLVMSISSCVFFENGDDEIKENSKQLLDKIGELLKYLDKPCVIEGNSNTAEINSLYYKSNWELSIVRAEKIAHYLIKEKQIDPQKIRAAGFGEMLPPTRNVNFTPQRIDFVILNYETAD